MSRHAEWTAANGSLLLKGDADALAEIRRATFIAAGADIDTEAPVYLWNGVWVKGEGDESHPVPDRVRAAYVRIPPPPGTPSAIWPEGLPRPGEIDESEQTPAKTDASRRQKLLELSLGMVEGDEDAILDLIQRTRRHHEVVPDMFPTEISAHWFENGILLLGPGDSPLVYQAPMAQLGEMIEPRAYPLLPLVRMPKRR